MKILYRVFSWIIPPLLLLALLFLAFRLELTPTFLQIEYRMPGFPPDTYGFTLEDRLYWSRFVWDYPLLDDGIDYLSDLTFTDGSPLFNDRELSHLEDVKRVVQPVMWIGYGSWLVLIGLGLWAYFGNWMQDYRLGLKRGGWAGVFLVIGIAAFAVIGFSQFFTVFHSFFFTGDSWLFLYSDTLIRLFPLRFWQDCFLYAGGTTFVGGLLLGLLVKVPKRNP